MNHDQPQTPQNSSDAGQELKESNLADLKKSETEFLGNFSGNSLHYNFEAGFGSKIEDLSEEMNIGKNIARSMAYDRGRDVSATIKVIPGKVWMEVSLTDSPDRIVTNITAHKKDGEWFVRHDIHVPEEITLRKCIEQFPFYHLLS